MNIIFPITKSKVRQELLALFFTNPERGYFQRELARLLGRSIGNIHQEILKLEQSGLLKRTKTANSIFFHLDKTYSLYHEIKGIVLKTIGIVPTLKTVLNKFKAIELAFIYGSYALQFANQKKAAQNWNSKSDIDLFIVGKPEATKLNQVINSLEKKFSREINYSVYGKREFIQKLHQRNSFILNIIRKPIIPLEGFGEYSSNSHIKVTSPAKWRALLRST